MARKKPAVDRADASPSDHHAPVPEAPHKGKGGAPRGNVNAAKDADFVLKMRKARRQVKKASARIRRECAARTAAIIAALKLDAHPLAHRLGSRLTSLDFKIIEVNRLADKLPKTTSDGSIASCYALGISLEREDRVECMKMLTMLAEIMAATAPPETEIVYTIKSADGSDLVSARESSDNDSTLPAETSALNGAKESHQSVRDSETNPLSEAKADPQEHKAQQRADDHRSALRSWRRGDDVFGIED